MDASVGVILAAGRGTRMGLLSETYPKALLPVANKPLIAHHITLLKDIGIKKIYIVVGYKSEKIKRVIGNGSHFGVSINYIEQERPSGSAHAMLPLASCVKGYFLLMLGDYFFSAPHLYRSYQWAMDTGATVIAAKRDSNQQALGEACLLYTDHTGKVKNIVEKPVVPKTDLKGCGLYICRPEIFDAVRRTPRTALRDEYEFTVSLDIYIKMGFPLYADEMIEWDVNFTRPSDVLRCNMMWLDQQNMSNLISTKASIIDGVTLNRSVIGDNVVIDKPCSLHETIVFTDTRLTQNKRIERSLVTPEYLITC